MDLTAIVESVTECSKHKRDMVIPMTELYPTLLPTGLDVGLRLGNKGDPKPLTDSGLSSFLHKLAIPTLLYKKCSPKLKLDLMSEFHLKQIQERASNKPLFVRLFKENVRFVGSGDYGKIDDIDVVGALTKITTQLKYTGFEQTEDCFTLRALTETPIQIDGLRPYFPGIQIVNSEVGKSRLKIQLILVEQVCTNGMVSGVFARAFGRVHKHTVQAADLVSESAKMIARIDAFALWAQEHMAKFINIPGKALMNRIQEDRDISKEIKDKTVELLPKYSRADSWNNPLDVVSAFTEAIQVRPRLERIRLEAFAGELISL